MNFKISKKLFANTLNIVSKAVSSTAPIPSLSGIKIKAYNESLILTGSDSNISIEKTIGPCDELTVIDNGEVVIEARYINEIVRKIDSDTINFEIIDGTLTRISGLKAEFKINGMRASDYPEIHFNYSNDIYDIDTKSLIELVHQTAFACSEKETRPALTGVNFKTSGNTLIASATDSYRLAIKKVNVGFNGDFNITISSKIINEVVSILSETKNVKFCVEEGKVFFIEEGLTILVRLIEDAYPDVARLIPSDFHQILEINSRELLDAVDRASFIKSDGKSVVKLKISSEVVEISSSNQEVGSSLEKLSLTSYVGNPITISCSGKYLTDAIRALKTDYISLSFSGELKPIIVKSKVDDSITQLISPTRSY